MVGETRRHPLILVPVVLLLAGCTGGGPPPDPGPVSASPTPSVSVALRSMPALRPPFGPAGPVMVGCGTAQRNSSGFDPLSADVVNLDPLFIMDNARHGGLSTVDGVAWAKDPFWVRAGRTVTVTVGQSHRQTTALTADGGSSQGNSSITFTACPEGEAAFSWWPGGFLNYYGGPDCVPLEVRVEGAAEVRRPVITIGDLKCPSSW